MKYPYLILTVFLIAGLMSCRKPGDRLMLRQQQPTVKFEGTAERPDDFEVSYKRVMVGSNREAVSMTISLNGKPIYRATKMSGTVVNLQSDLATPNGVKAFGTVSFSALQAGEL